MTKGVLQMSSLRSRSNVANRSFTNRSVDHVGRSEMSRIQGGLCWDRLESIRRMDRDLHDRPSEVCWKMLST